MLGAGIGCIDLDYCFGSDGSLLSWARHIVDNNPDSFIERSVSGEGLHIFGLLPERRGMRKAGVEVYSRDRFILTTRDVYQAGDLVLLNTEQLATM